MSDAAEEKQAIADDERRLARLGYAQELSRAMGAFSNYAVSLSITCTLAGGGGRSRASAGAALVLRLEHVLLAVAELRLGRDQGAERLLL
jgi:hypothetical protein